MSVRGWAAVAAIPYLAGLTVLFGLRTWLRLGATGSIGFNGITRRDGWARTAGLLFGVAMLAGVAALVLAATGTIKVVAPAGLVLPLAIAGLLLTCAGLSLAWAAQSSLGTAGRIGVDPGETTGLVTTGLFSRARNPIFTAMIAAQAGTVLMAPSWLSLAALAVLVVAIQLQVRRVEEPYLRASHGADYGDYTTRVGRFVPLVGRHHAPPQHRQAAGDERGPGHDHNHGHPNTTAVANRRRIAVALTITGAVLIAEVIGAVWTGSLALLADAGHMLTDAAGLVLALIAAHLMTRPATTRRTWGYQRAETLAAAAQALLLLGVGIYVLVEGIRRLLEPPEVASTGMLVFGIVGLVGNAVSITLLTGGHNTNLNLRAAFLEVLNDALGSVAVIVAAIVIATTGWTRADAIVSLIIGVLILPRTITLLRDTARVLLETTPAGLDLDDVRGHILDVDHVRAVHDLHASQIATGLPVLTAHVVVDDECFFDGHLARLLDDLQTCVASHFPVSVEHSTFQFEQASHAEHEPSRH